MYFECLLLHAFVWLGRAVSLQDANPPQPLDSETGRRIVLFNERQSVSFDYNFLMESETLRLHINNAERNYMENAKNKKTEVGCMNERVSLDGIVPSKSNTDLKLRISDSFDLKILSTIMKMRHEFVRSINTKYLRNIFAFSSFLRTYAYLNFSPNMQTMACLPYSVYQKAQPMDKNVVFALNIIYKLAELGHLRYYKRVVSNIREFDKDLLQVNNAAIGDFTPEKLLQKILVQLPEVKSAIALCEVKKDKKIVIRHESFNFTLACCKSGEIISEIAGKKHFWYRDEIDIEQMLLSRDEYRILRIVLPIHDLPEYCRAILHYLHLVRSTTKIIFAFTEATFIDKIVFNWTGKSSLVKSVDFLSKNICVNRYVSFFWYSKTRFLVYQKFLNWV
ncbi:hypothetical protein ENBRE01_2573 [Enteropsectra breve]|nr:hypothetical protein ENBRE01_2483 [Enteropsectra breve]KAI5152107.1 hypothetical protein ENBRE01_2573 [Enteropsectra breve]